MKNSKFLLSFFLSGILFSVNPGETDAGSKGMHAAVSDEKPNIILIMADDMSWADVEYKGLENSDFYETPNIDQLASGGKVFHRFYPSAANCAPSRATLLTGMYHPRHGVYVPQGYSRGGEIANMRWKTPAHGADESFVEAFEVSVNRVDPGFESLAEMLKRAGYVSARLGKWHIGDDNQGFDLSSAEGTPNYITNLYGNEQRFYTDVTVAERLTDTAVQFMSENRDRPFFLYLSHWEPHGPLAARQERIRYYAEKPGVMEPDHEVDISTDYDPGEYDRLREQSAGYDAAVYAAMIEQLDISTGRIMAALKALDIEENTILVFTSDNGGVSDYTSNKPLRAGKGTFYEGGIRTPFVVRWPAVIEPGTESDVAISGVDFMPTFAEIASVPVPQEQPVDGASFLPLLTGEEDSLDRPLFFHFPLYLGPAGTGTADAVLPVHNGPGNYWRAVPLSVMMKGDYKLIYYHEYERAELYNLRKDLSEQHDLSGVETERATRMTEALFRWIEETGAPVPDQPNPAFNL